MNLFHFFQHIDSPKSETRNIISGLLLHHLKFKTSIFNLQVQNVYEVLIQNALLFVLVMTA